MPKKLKRWYGYGHLHFITFSCYQRKPLLRSARACNELVRILGEVRARHGFKLIGYVVMPELVHLLISEPRKGTPSTVLQVLKQRLSRRLRKRRRKPAGQFTLWRQDAARLRKFWQRRFYDFNVWSARKLGEKLNYMHHNPVQRGLVHHPRDWPWSSYRFYSGGGAVLLAMDRVA